jgi:hypothetical protein
MGIPTTIDNVVDVIANDIEESIPSYEPQALYTLYEGDLDLEGKAAIQGDESQRFFTAHGLPDFNYGSWNGNVANVRQTITITLRYRVEAVRGGVGRVRRMFASDNMQIAGLITSARPSIALRQQIIDAQAVRNPRLSPRGQGVYTGRLDLSVQYFYRRL